MVADVTLTAISNVEESLFVVFRPRNDFDQFNCF